MLFSRSNSAAAARQGGSGSSDQVTRPAKRACLIVGKQNKEEWTAASHSSSTRSMQEYVDKKEGWDPKLKKCKNALARTTVCKAFAGHEPKGCKGTRFSQKDVIPEKGVINDQGL